MFPRTHFDGDHEQFRDTASRFYQGEIGPNSDRWRQEGCVDREAFTKAGEQGYLLMWADEAYGGLGIRDLRYEQIIHEENNYYGDPAFYQNLHAMIVAPYFDKFGTQAQKQKYLPKAASGEIILAIAMTEPNAGSDLVAIRTKAEDKGEHWLLNGSKTYISNGILSDVLIVAARTGSGRSDISLFIVERGMAGFERGANLKKMGLHAQDTAELFFKDVHLPKESLLGELNKGFVHMTQCLAIERLMTAITSIAHAQVAFDLTLDYVKERRIFGKPLGAMQNTRFILAQLRAELDAQQTYVDQSILLANAGVLSAEQASAAKLLTSELEGKVMDSCLQLHGGAGYMDEYRISRLYTDARVSRIFAGANEIMLEIIGRGLGLDERKMT
ncbi:acyl-CoA dehydrogenase family protein [Psychrobacter sanguinis]|uniref:Acyl-CoA dehydrogenase n=1 Tax=Psychrobacter sanguinis TaxID=861445 RepID=A0A844M3I9_9GAMM|nr:acyl-CoA dehydrogenase family protein [Psychrobacter sanguinis]MUG33374.1 acyl-CoA dehydrogenase [Psychrobacter sanguinis]